jgi:hypothetical protein
VRKYVGLSSLTRCTVRPESPTYLHFYVAEIMPGFVACNPSQYHADVAAVGQAELLKMPK